MRNGATILTTGSPPTPPGHEQGRVEAAEHEVRDLLRRDVRQVMDRKGPAGAKHDAVAGLLRVALGEIGRVYRTAHSVPLFFRTSTRRLYEVGSRSETAFARFVTYLVDLSPKMAVISGSLDRLSATISEQAQTVTVHAAAYNSADLDAIAVNDFGGGMWYRQQGGTWEWKPNGYDGILFWTPPDFVEPWAPDSGGPAEDEAALEWFVNLPHFADDVLSASDQRMLLRALLLAPFFPARCRTRPVQAHLGLSRERQHDTGKTMAGKLLGYFWVGAGFEPTPVKRAAERGEEDLQLTLMNQPFVLLDNVDTDISWLNDFLCTYATGARPTRRKHYENTTLVYYEYRGRLCVTSRKARFNRADVASRTIPFRFRPIAREERKAEWELSEPVLARRGRIWAGVLQTVAVVQDAFREERPPTSVRLADFEALGWVIAKRRGEETAWTGAMGRLEAAQAGFALEEEALFPILQHILAQGDVPEQPTSEFFEVVRETGAALDLVPPATANHCTQRLNELRELLEARLDAKIYLRTLHGKTMVRISRGPSWKGAQGDLGDVSSDLLAREGETEGSAGESALPTSPASPPSAPARLPGGVGEVSAHDG